MIYPLPEISNKNTISKDKIFQFETLFCHEQLLKFCMWILCVLWLTLNHIVEMNQRKAELFFYKMWMDICVHCNVFETFNMQKLAKL